MKKIWLVCASALLVLVAGMATFLLLNSTGSLPIHTTENGESAPNAISEIRDVSINGVNQRLLIRGANKDNPLLLHLHGGPGGPDQAIIQSKGQTIEDIFTVVYWDQRGSGASYHADRDGSKLTLNQLVEDGVTISDMLLSEFGQEKLYLQGHSWGTLLGVNMISKAPDRYKAFFAVGLFANSKQSERLSWEYVLAAAKAAGDDHAIQRLTEMGSPPFSTDEEWIRNVTEQRKLLWPYENPNAEPLFNMAEVYWMFATYSGYTIGEKLRSLGGLDYTMADLWPVVVETNLIKSHTQFDVPFYVFQGKYDQHTVTQVAREYFDVINAPDKAYHLFQNSAHWPHISEYDLYRMHIKEHMQKIERQ